MDKKDFLFELGVEEMPVGYINGAVKTLTAYFNTNLKNANLEYDDLQIFSTPRRFAIKITSLQTQQEDKVVERVGPTKEMAYNKAGNLTKAALGFLRGADADEKDIMIQSSAKGDKIAISKKIKGKSTISILKDIIESAINEIKFPKSMRWGSYKLVFARPIRWLLILFGNEIVEFEFENIRSGNITFGNRFQDLDNSVEINTIQEYEEKLTKSFVIPNREERKKLICNQMEDLFIDSSENIIENNKLLEIVTDLVEYPTAVIAHFHKKYLELPEKVVTSTLSEHQKYFSISKKNGELSNKFLFISNGDPQYSEFIKQGNEKVVTARLEDAEFFYKEDTSRSLDTYVPKLSEVTFQQKLGSVLEKTERIKKITVHICNELAVSKEVKKHSLCGANLCKADLVTLMLGEKEFTKLQGYIGSQYALKSGEEKEVALVIEEHYQNGESEMSTAGSIVAIADKIDTICGIIGVDMIPTGSKDPFALRRAANGVVQILSNNNFEIDIHKLIDMTYKLLESKLDEPEKNKNIVYDFFKQRVNWLLKQEQIDYDVIDSVMHIDLTNIPDLLHRAKALQNFKQREDFIKLVLGFKRVSNIIVKLEGTSNVDTELLQDDMEQVLYKEYLELNKRIKNLLPNKNYGTILEKLVEYGKTIDKFFDEVLVNVENTKIRQNRYNILSCIRKLFLQVADLNRIVVENEK
ncbi:MAG: glycine--tRNA ligase subunit beta [Candidatus Tenebribacter davisii]|nr:glycine--tRNA ligase subunit beta [Candidatus Tenebribacter davisii]